MAGKYTVEGVFGAKDRFSRVVSKMEGRFARFTRKMKRMSDGMSRGFSAIGGALKKVGLAAVAAGAAVGAALAHTIGVGEEFEQTMVAAAAKFPEGIEKGTAAFLKLEDVARKVGGETEFTASQAAQGLNFLAMAGFNANQSVAALPGLVNLATAAQLELGEASDIATDTLGAFGMASKDAAVLAGNLTRVNDVLAKTANSANTDVVQLFEAIKAGGPVANAAGSSIEQFSAMAGIMANAGFKGEVAGTALRNMFLRLQAPPSAAAGSLETLGVKTEDANKNFRGMVPVLEDITKAMEGMGTAEQARHMDNIFGKRAIGGATVLMQAGRKEIEKFTKTLDDAGGTSDDVAAKMRNTFQGMRKSLLSAFEAVEISVFKEMQPDLEKLVTTATAWIRANKEDISAGFKKALTVIKDLSAVFGGAFMDTLGAVKEGFMAVLGPFAEGKSTLKDWMPMLKQVATTLGQLAAIAVGAAVAFGGLVVVAARIIETWKTLLTGVFSTVTDVLGSLLTPWIDTFNNIMAILDSSGLSIGEKALGIGKALMMGIVDGIKSMLTAPHKLLLGAAKSWLGAVKTALGISSPSKKMAALGRSTADGMAMGILGGLSGVERAAQRMSDVVSGASPPTIKIPTVQMPRINALSLSNDGDDDEQDDGTKSKRKPQGGIDVVSPSGPQAMRSVLREESVSRHDIVVSAESGAKASIKDPKRAAKAGLRMQPSGA